MTKTRTGLLAIMTTVVMLFAMAVAAAPALAGTITITPPSGTQIGTTNEYKIYKVFDATGNGTNISYTLPSGKSISGDMAKYFEVQNGNVQVKDAAKDATDESKLNEDAIAAIATYVGSDQPVATVISTGTKDAATTTDLPAGYYYITTSTGTVVTIDSTNPNATVKDKNTLPNGDKFISGVTDGSWTKDTPRDGAHLGKAAIAELGSTVTYQATVTFPKGYKNVKFHDTMSSGLQLASGDGAISISYKNGTEDYTPDTDATIRKDASAESAEAGKPDTGDTFTIDFPSGIDNNVVATITYKATVTSDALTTDPATNKATITYGDNSGKTEEKTTEVFNGKITFTKTFQGLDESASLPNGEKAVFVLTKTSGDSVQYYHKNGNDVEWVTSSDPLNDNNVTRAEIAENGKTGSFTGLPNGTYTLKEIQTPSGYNTAADQTITINGVDENVSRQQAKEANGALTQGNLEQSAAINNTAGSALPNTGGPGTTLMYIIGAALVIAAAVALIARRKSRQQ